MRLKRKAALLLVCIMLAGVAVAIPDTLTVDGVKKTVNEIPADAFNGSEKLKSVLMSDTVEKIGRCAFKNCSKLEKLKFGKNVKQVNRSAFYGCRKLDRVELNDKLEYVGSYVFKNCTSLKSFTFGSGVKKLGSSIFSGCTSLESIVIPKSVKSMGKNLFYGCRSLKTLTIETTKLNSNNLAKGVFNNVPKNLVIYVPKSKKSDYEKLFREKGLSSNVRIEAIGKRTEPDSFTVTKDYCLVADEGLENISRKVNEYIGLIYGNEGFREVQEAADKYLRLTVDKDVKDDNGNSCDYAYTSDGQNITVTGRNREHVLRGALAFLEEFGGIRCYASDMIVPTQTAITYPVELVGHSKTYSDYFEMIDSWLISALDDDYSWFRGYNANGYRFFVDERQDFETEEEADERIKALTEYYRSMGGSVEYISYFCHTFTRQFCSPDIYYDTYPECFALNFDNSRRRDELCLSSEKTLEIVMQEVFDLLESDRYNPEAEIQIISLTQNDDGAMCQCEKCLTEAWEHGGESYVNLKFVNEVARAVKNRKQDSKGNPVDYSNVLIDTFAYVYTRSAPNDIIPEDNVIIRLCPFGCCSGHYIDDEDCPDNKAFMKDLMDWSRLTDRLYIWGYSTDYVYYGVPFPDIEVLAHNLRVFYDIGVRGVYTEVHQMSGWDLYTDKIGTEFEYAVWRKTEETEFYELRAYVISKVMQDPYCDYHKVVREFCDGYYGDAGAAMYEIITRMDLYAPRNHLRTDSTPRNIFTCSKAELTELNDLFAKAVSMASAQMEAAGVSGVTDYLKHVKNSELCWRYYKMMCRLFEFSDSSEYESAQEQLYFDFYANNVTRLHDPGAEIGTELETVEAEMLSRYRERTGY